MTTFTGPLVVTDTVGTDGSLRVEHRDDLVDAIRGWLVRPDHFKPSDAANDRERRVLEVLDQLEAALRLADHRTVHDATEYLGVRIDPAD